MAKTLFKLTPGIWTLAAIWGLVVVICWRACQTTVPQAKWKEPTKPKPVSAAATAPDGTFEFATRENRFTLLPGGNRALVHIPGLGDVEGKVSRDVVLPRPASLEIPEEKEWLFSPKLVITDDEGFLLFLRWDTPHVRWAIPWEKFLEEHQRIGFDSDGKRLYSSDPLAVVGRARIRLDDPNLAEICTTYAFMRHSSELYTVRIRQFANSNSRYEADCLLSCEANPGFPRDHRIPEFRRGYANLTLIRINETTWNLGSKLPGSWTWCRDEDGSEWWCTDPEAPLPNWQPVVGTPAVEKAQKELTDPLSENRDRFLVGELREDGT